MIFYVLILQNRIYNVHNTKHQYFDFLHFWADCCNKVRCCNGLGEWCKMFQSLQLHFPAWHGLLYLHCCSQALLQNHSSKWFSSFFAVLMKSLGPSPQSGTPCRQSFPCCTVSFVWLALGAREIPYAQSLLIAHWTRNIQVQTWSIGSRGRLAAIQNMITASMSASRKLKTIDRWG